MKTQGAVSPLPGQGEKSGRGKGRQLDIIIYSLCLLGMFLSLNAFRLDLNQTLTRQNEQPVGTISFKRKSAQRRFSDRVLWDRLRQESPIYDGDFIRTAELSEATITFVGGGVVDLSESTLIQLHGDSRGARIDISEGAVNAAALGTTLVLASGDRLITLDQNAVVRAGVGGGDLLYRVLEGSAAGENGTALKAAALAPRPSARLLFPGEGKLTVPFRWNRIDLNPEEPVRLEVAENQEFTRMVFQGDFTGQQASTDLGAGVYYWRISVPGEEDSPSLMLNTSAFRVVAVPPPVLITPAQGYLFQYRARRPQVRFQWAEITEVVSYLLEAADNPEMNNPLLAREVQGTSLYTSELGPGTWYWRVRPLFPPGWEGAIGEASPASFQIVQRGSLEAPELQSPDHRGLVNISQGRGDLYFSWQAGPEAMSYTIRISPNQDLSEALINGVSRDNFFIYRAEETLLRPGIYYWAVFQTDVEGNDSAFSEGRSFTAIEGELIQRTVFPPDGYTIAVNRLPDLRFTWKSNLPLATRFQVSDRADFGEMVQNEEVVGEGIQGRPLPEGRWYWRIRAESPAGSVFETPPKSFIIAQALPAPVLREPADAGRALIPEGTALQFVWEASRGAEYYQFKLFHQGNPNEAVFENLFYGGTRLSLLMDPYPEGEYRWTVQGFASESSLSTRRSGLLAEGLFTARKVRPISLDYPANGAQIEGLTAYFQPEMVQWSSVDQAVETRFVLSQRPDFRDPLSQTDNPAQTLTLPRLRPGTYYWTVRGQASDGFDISPQAPRSFTVLPIPPLPAVENLLPRNGRVITAADLRQNRSISFSWDEMPEATAYLFALQKESGPVILQEILGQPGFVLEDLTLLDRGTFVWRVEAVMVDSLGDRGDEGILRRGQEQESRFSLDFALPGAARVQEPGLLYGRE
ncbi:MAG: hypothetical protein LBQ61_04335 [Spirochaetales bacterium]|jgi:hypothetical protein|nr:hypothetical protein [Spirochaetales bacterium]